MKSQRNGQDPKWGYAADIWSDRGAIANVIPRVLAKRNLPKGMEENNADMDRDAIATPNKSPANVRQSVRQNNK